MDHDQSPDHSPPDHERRARDEMATMVASSAVPNMPGPTPLPKRYRPAPAKTFQCRGYGECRMVFSRSEHLARHIRKHTGERPFSCHCGKQFSRLDNLRQHAQTVHADKHDQNERMMRDLTSLHATMAAANKGNGSARAPRRGPAPPNVHTDPVQSEPSPNDTLNLIKQEEGTRGFEPDIYELSPAWGSEMDMPHQQHEARRPSGQHSFRGDPSQSFLAPQSSFRPQYYDGRPGSSSSRPPTGQSLPPLAAVVSASIPSPSAGPPSASSAAFPFPGSLALRRPGTASRPGTAPSGGGGGASAAFFNDGPPGSSSGKSAGYSTLGLGSGSLLHAGFGPSTGRGSSSSGLFAYMGGYDAPHQSSGNSPTSAAEPSPFFFQPPALDQQQQQQPPAPSPPAANPRKRAFGAPDGPYENNAPAGREPALPPANTLGGLGLGLGMGFGAPDASSGGGGGGGYEYGTESRPQSRRLSVMELCNDDAQRQQQANQATLAHALAATDRERYASAGYAPPNGHGHGAPAPAAFLLPAAAGAEPGGGYGGGYGLSPSASGERPATATTALASSASALHIFDSDGSNDGRRYSNGSGHAAHGNGNGSGSGSASPAGAVYDAAGRGGYPGGGQSPIAHGSHSPPDGYASAGPGSFYAASPAVSVHTHHHPTPTPSPHPGMVPAPYALAGAAPGAVYAAGGQHHHQQQQQQQQHAQQQYQFAVASSPSFSGASSVASYASPRSPASDGSGGGSTSPFSAYAQHHAQHAQHPQHQQQQQQQYGHAQQYEQQHQQQQHAPQQQQQQSYHHAGYGGQQQQQQQRVSPTQYDVPGGYYDAAGVARAAPRGHFQQQQQYGGDGRYHHGHGHGHGHEQRYAPPAAAGHGHGHGHGHGQQHDVRISVSPHATPTFGMRA